MLLILDHRLSNAFKFTQKGKITVSVAYDADNAYVRVTDTGILLVTLSDH